MTFLNVTQAREALANFKLLPQSEAITTSGKLVEFITKSTTKPRDKCDLMDDILTYFYQPNVNEFLDSFNQTDLDQGVLGNLASLNEQQLNDLYSKVGEFLNNNATIIELALACATIYTPPFFTGQLEENNSKLFAVLYCYFIDRSLPKENLTKFATTLILTSIYCKIVHNGTNMEDEKCGELLGLLKAKVPISSLIRTISSNTLPSLDTLQNNQTFASKPNTSFLVGIRQNFIIKLMLDYNKLDDAQFERSALTPTGSAMASPAFATQNLTHLLTRNNSGLTLFGGAAGVNSNNNNSNNSRKRPLDVGTTEGYIPI